GVRLELLPRPGNLDAAADARLGRVRCRRRVARAVSPKPLGARCRGCGARLRVQREHGRLALVRVLAAHRAGARGSGGQGAVVRRRPCRGQRRHRARRRPGASPHARSLRRTPAHGGRVGVAAALAAAFALAVALVALAEEALGYRNASLLARLSVKPSGEIGDTLNATYWGVLALGHSSAATTRFILAHQSKAGGFSWFAGSQPDSNDTAAALEALHVAGVHGAAVARAVKFLR